MCPTLLRIEGPGPVVATMTNPAIMPILSAVQDVSIELSPADTAWVSHLISIVSPVIALVESAVDVAPNGSDSSQL